MVAKKDIGKHTKGEVKVDHADLRSNLKAQNGIRIIHLLFVLEDLSLAVIDQAIPNGVYQPKSLKVDFSEKGANFRS